MYLCWWPNECDWMTCQVVNYECTSSLFSFGKLLLNEGRKIVKKLYTNSPPLLVFLVCSTFIFWYFDLLFGLSYSWLIPWYLGIHRFYCTTFLELASSHIKLCSIYKHVSPCHVSQSLVVIIHILLLQLHHSRRLSSCPSSVVSNPSYKLLP